LFDNPVIGECNPNKKGDEKMKRISRITLVIFLAISLSACASGYKKTEKALDEPINCATAEGDIRALENEKAHVAEQIAMGVSSIIPVGLVVGIVTGSAGTKFRVATGEYDKMIDEKIAEIKSECGL
jgi:hypothetical protein